MISDLHLGSGPKDRLEDFFYDAQFSEFLSEVVAPRPTQLIINGDFIDFPQIMPIHRHAEFRPPHRSVCTTESQSKQRVALAIAGHRDFFNALGRWLRNNKSSELILVPGNHDIDLYWPQVRRSIGKAIGCSIRALRPHEKVRSQVSFANYGYYQDDVTYIEHGNRFDPYNAFTADFTSGELPIKTNGEGRLERCTGTLFLDELFNSLEERFPAVDGLYPELAALEWMLNHHPELLSSEMVAQLAFFFLKHPVTLTSRAHLGLLEAPSEVRDFDVALSLIRDKRIAGNFTEIFEQHVRNNAFRSNLQRLVNDLGRKDWIAIEESIAVQPGQLVFEPEMHLPGTLETFTGKSVYERRAEALIEDRGVRNVIFGHTHGELTKSVNGGNMLNSGTWTWCYDIARNPDKIVKLDQFRPELRKQFPYIEVDGGAYLRYFAPN